MCSGDKGQAVKKTHPECVFERVRREGERWKDGGLALVFSPNFLFIFIAKHSPNFIPSFPLILFSLPNLYSLGSFILACDIRPFFHVFTLPFKFPSPAHTHTNTVSHFSDTQSSNPQFAASVMLLRQQKAAVRCISPMSLHPRAAENTTEPVGWKDARGKEKQRCLFQ